MRHAYFSASVTKWSVQHPLSKTSHNLGCLLTLILLQFFQPSFILRLSPQFFPGVSKIQSNNLCEEKTQHRHLLPRYATISCNVPWLSRQWRRENRHWKLLQNETTFLSPCFRKLLGWLGSILQLDSCFLAFGFEIFSVGLEEVVVETGTSDVLEVSDAAATGVPWSNTSLWSPLLPATHATTLLACQRGKIFQSSITCGVFSILQFQNFQAGFMFDPTMIVGGDSFSWRLILDVWLDMLLDITWKLWCSCLVDLGSPVKHMPSPSRPWRLLKIKVETKSCVPLRRQTTWNCPTSKSCCLRRQLTYSGLQDSLAMVWTGKAFRSCQLLGKPVGKACASPENLRNCLRHAYLPEYVKFMHVIDPSLKKRRHTSAFFSFIMLSWFCIASIWNDISHKFNLKSTNIRWFTWHQAMAPLGSGCWNTLKLQISALQGTNILHQEFIPWL